MNWLRVAPTYMDVIPAMLRSGALTSRPSRLADPRAARGEPTVAQLAVNYACTRELSILFVVYVPTRSRAGERSASGETLPINFVASREMSPLLSSTVRSTTRLRSRR